MKVVLFGAGGMLGHDLRTACPAAVELLPLTHADVDVTDQRAVHTIIRGERPDVVINATGYTSVDAAESDSETAFAVNGAAPGTIGQAARLVDAAVVHFSTDYVFDGEAGRPYAEDVTPNPLNVYGRSKLEGEVRLQASGAALLIIRTQWLFGLHGRSFPRTMWDRASRGERTTVVADQTGRPTYTRDLARAAWRLVSLGARGMLHVANSGTATWYDLASRVFARAGTTELLVPCSAAEYPTPARRPAAAVLDTRRFDQLTGGQMPRWEEALDRFLAERTGTSALASSSA